MDIRHTDTIAAIATAMSSSGIGIIRISGSQAYLVASRVFRSKKKNFDWASVPSHTIHYGTIVYQGEVLDEVLLMIMKGPHSYTAEDTIEIDCHGGVLVMKRILEAVIASGARPAEPGEFTKRAFLNGRIDLSQAEAVMDVIQSRNDYAMKSSVSQLNGLLSKKIHALREELLYQLAYIESALDDPEHISLEGFGLTLKEKLIPMMELIRDMIRSFDHGKMMSEGIKTVILGKPNAGKSSLLNVLVGEERAIVTDIAGTTRDTLEEHIRMREISLNIIDTAGIRETENLVEQIGVSKAKAMADDADLILYVVDGSCNLDENDENIMELIRNRQALVLLNKSDLKMEISERMLEEKTGKHVITVSAKEGTGFKELEVCIRNMFYEGTLDFNDQIIITNVRHRAALENSLESLCMVMEGIDGEMPEDLLTIDLMGAYEQLGTIIGEAVGEDLVNEIFGKFCMGK